MASSDPPGRMTRPRLASRLAITWHHVFGFHLFWFSNFFSPKSRKRHKLSMDAKEPFKLPLHELNVAVSAMLLLAMISKLSFPYDIDPLSAS